MYSSILCMASILILIASSFSSACNQDDKAALLVFKSSFPAEYFDSWTDATDCCFWSYIQCDSTGRVSSLSVSDNTLCDDITCPLPPIDLHGSIPPSIGDISTLKEIFFDDLPNLVGPIPPQLSKLKHLQSLTIYNTSVSGPIPSSLTKLKNLSHLDLTNNKLCGKIPTGGNFDKFEADSYYNNKCLCGAPLHICCKSLMEFQCTD